MIVTIFDVSLGMEIQLRNFHFYPNIGRREEQGTYCVTRAIDQWHEIFIKNRNFRQKSKFWSKNEILV